MVDGVQPDHPCGVIKVAVCRMKQTLLRIALSVLPIYFRHVPSQRAKVAIWNKLLARHGAWRNRTLSATSIFGARFVTHLSDVLQAYLYFFGVWEPVITRYLLDELTEGDVFIDVGANIGYYTLLASGRVGRTGRVFAIEAASGTFAQLKQNLALNDARNVSAFHVAVSDRSGHVPIWLNEGGELAGATTLAHVAERRRAMRQVETVEAKPLGDIIDPAMIRAARVIKIDVEGAEWAVVQSIAGLLKTVSPRTEFIIEVNQALVTSAGGTVEELLGYFAAAGFAPFVIANGYDAAFVSRKVGRVQLRRFDGGTFRQLDLVFRRTAGGAR